MAKTKSSAARKPAETDENTGYKAYIGDTPVEEFPGVETGRHNAPKEANVIAIPLRNLQAWEGNVRKTAARENLGELKASILSLGVLTSLVVLRGDPENYMVCAGGRRLAALQELAAEGKIPADYAVPCRVLEAGANADEVSLAENVIRQGLNPADEFEAFQALIANGAHEEDIAARFGCGVTTVRKRLKLANVSPVILKDFREGKLELAELQAFAITDNHKTQEAVAREHGYGNNTEWLRDILMEDKARIAADDPRICFVGGIPACKAAGIALVEDLFDPAAGYVEDAKALQKLVDKVAKERSDEFKAQGWVNVEFCPAGLNTTEIYKRFGYSYEGRDPKQSSRDLSPADEKMLKDAEREHKELGRNIHKHNEAQRQRYEQVIELINELGEKRKYWTDKVKQSATVLFAASRNGFDVRIAYDRAAAKEVQKEEKSSAKKKPAAASEKKGAAKKKDDDQDLTWKALEELTAHRTTAISAELATQTKVGFAAFCATAIDAFFDGLWADPCFNFEIHEADEIPFELDRKGMLKGRDEFRKLEAKIRGILPKRNESTFKWALAQKTETLVTILAFIAAANYTDITNDGKPQKQTEELMEALELDMSQWYTPTAKNLFSKFGAKNLQSIVKEIRGGPLTPAEAALTREGLAALAEREAAAKAKEGKPWLPAPLRTKAAKDKPANAKPAAKPAAKAKAKPGAKKK